MIRARHLARDQRGTAVIEFGLLLPVILGTFLGVLQIGISMFAYNSLRNVTAEASRYALVEYQNNREMADWSVLRDRIITIAPGSGLSPSRMTVTVGEAAIQRVSGAIELQISVTYQVQSVLPFLGINEIETNYTRPVFLIDESIATGTPGSI